MLESSGTASVAVELPMTSLADDIAETHRALDAFAHPAVLVGHSYGGAVITAAGSHQHVKHLLYLAAFQLAEGESVGHTLPDLGVLPTRLGDALRFHDDDTVTLDPTLAAECLYNDAPTDAAAASVARLRPVHKSVFSGVPDVISWHQVQSTYVVCADDLAVHPELQRATAARAASTHEWRSGHSPALTHPDAIVDLLQSIADPGQP
jgi:pimeloyl-ACP methyl ester carboxylesterase